MNKDKTQLIFENLYYTPIPWKAIRIRCNEKEKPGKIAENKEINTVYAFSSGEWYAQEEIRKVNRQV